MCNCLWENQNFAVEKKAIQNKINLDVKKSSYFFPCFIDVAAYFLHFFEETLIQNILRKTLGDTLP